MLRDHVGAPARDKVVGAVRREWVVPDLRSDPLLDSTVDSAAPEVLLLANVLWLLDEAFVSLGFDEAAELVAPAVKDVGANGFRSALRKAATPAFVLS